MSKKNEVNHEGIVQSKDGNIIKVKILSKSACAECHAKGVCSVADISEKIIDCEKDGHNYDAGEKVKVVMEEKFGWIAILYAFIIPFIVMISTLVISIISGLDEKIAGVLALVALPPYYFILYLLSEKITKNFIFKISKFS